MMDPNNIHRRNLVEDRKLSSTGKDSQIILNTLKLYGSLYLCCVVLFVIIRKKYPLLFNIRSWSTEHKCDLAQKEYGWLSWYWEVFRVPDYDLQDQCGMDAVCFLRALAFGKKLSLLGCFNAIWLIPMYYTEKNYEETSYPSNPFVLMSVSNLPSESVRFIGTVIAAYITYGYAMYLITKECEWYTALRHRFLSKREPRNYAVYVSGIPKDERSSRELEHYFQKCCINEVLEAHIARETPELDNLVARRKIVVENLEHAVAQEHLTEKIATHVKVDIQRGVETVESVREFEKELAELNASITKSIEAMNVSTDPYTDTEVDAHNDKFPASSALDGFLVEAPDASGAQSSSLSKFEPTICPPVHPVDEGCADESFLRGDEIDPPTEVSGGMDKVKENESMQAAIERELHGNGESGKQDTSRSKSVVDGTERARSTTAANSSKAAGSGIVATSKIAGDTIVEGSRVVGAQAERFINTAGDIGVETLQLAHDVGTQVLTSAGAVVPLLLSQAEGEPREGGFVVFTSLYATQAALQMVHHQEPYVFGIQPCECLIVRSSVAHDGLCYFAQVCNDGHACRRPSRHFLAKHRTPAPND
jgi:hypothetical protein